MRKNNRKTNTKSISELIKESKEIFSYSSPPVLNSMTGKWEVIKENLKTSQKQILSYESKDQAETETRIAVIGF